MNFFHDVSTVFVGMGVPHDAADYLVLLLFLIVTLALLWYPYLRAANAFLRRQRSKEAAKRVAEEEEIKPKKDAARAALMRTWLEERERLARAQTESAAAMSIFEAEQQRLLEESVRAADDLQRIKQHLTDTKPEFERAMQMGHEVLAIQARDADIRQAGGVPPLFRVTRVMRAVNQQLYDHKKTGQPITQPAFMEYAQHPCMR